MSRTLDFLAYFTSLVVFPLEVDIIHKVVASFMVVLHSMEEESHLEGE